MPSRNALLLLLGTGAVGAVIAGASGAQSKPLVMGSFESPKAPAASDSSSSADGLAPIAEEDANAPALVLPIVSATGPLIDGPVAAAADTSVSVMLAPRFGVTRPAPRVTPTTSSPGGSGSPSSPASPAPAVIWEPSGSTTTTTVAARPTTSTTSTTAPRPTTTTSTTAPPRSTTTTTSPPTTTTTVRPRATTTTTAKPQPSTTTTTTRRRRG